MKGKIQASLQYLLGYRRYLFLFSIFKYFTMRYDKRLEDFFYFLKIIPESKAVLDIGANLGYMSLLFSKKTINNKVVAFEPILDNFEVLTQVFHFFKINNALCFNLALGDTEKNIEMVTPIIKGVKKQGLSQVLVKPENYNGLYEKFKVKQKKLDSISELTDLDIGAIKIDVESYEYFVLKGGYSLIKKNKPIIFCELWEKENFTKCKILLEELDYKIYFYKEGRLLPYLLDKPSTIINFFFIPPVN